MTTKAQPLALRLICDARPDATHNGRLTEFGLQDKKGMLHPGTPMPNGATRYDFVVTVERKPNVAAPKFGGPFVHGPGDVPFLYLGYREAQDGVPWIRRLKIPLKSIVWALVEAAQADDAIIEGRVSGQGSGTVPLLGDGWTVRHSEKKK